ncbi:DoxX family protein [Pseudomonas gingeri]|uniref:DoxX family protein n=1 Tax=Pseudomonas gingeri TaxID=117681 RepID=A0A7Y7YJV7_9PSED|nr:DoxX family protein [Pseudomonas gingeri]NWA04858.1 DoxX family protein [Pseudomonas gingeri]NWA17739.1 DoxX family protein [Pseudomonas gingeri]NWA56853.1 DoxX family protein [Pseudomonas gingeri]NWA97281.1 DoxX family protein [Pseudomonas gingeri]NWB01667.1 DoxX family protein [Pseudomonas gingeri]
MNTAPPAKSSLKRLIQLATHLPDHRPLGQWAPLALRLIVGYGFMAHGLAKLFRGPEAFTVILQAMHFPFAAVFSWLTVVIEVFGGLAILLGAFVTLASIPMLITLLVATFAVHLPYGFSSIKLLSVGPNGALFGQPGYETDLLYMAALITLVIGGPGPFAVDHFLRRWAKGPGRTAEDLR